MKRIESSFVDKSAWGPGPWHNEPDKIQWRDAATGLPCLIVRGPIGALCGYVGVTEDHPAFKLDYEDLNVDVHGGLTFAGQCQEAGPICHVVEPGEPDHVMWFGFDCGHYQDFTPAHRSMPGDVYRDLAYVTREVESLAAQLAAQAKGLT